MPTAEIVRAVVAIQIVVVGNVVYFAELSFRKNLLNAEENGVKTHIEGNGNFFTAALFRLTNGKTALVSIRDGFFANNVVSFIERAYDIVVVIKG